MAKRKTDYEKLKLKQEKELKKLQDTCNHKKFETTTIHDWFGRWKIKACSNCMKEFEKKWN